MRLTALLALLVLGSHASASNDPISCIIRAGTDLVASPAIQAPLSAFNHSRTDVMALEQRWAELDKSAPEILDITNSPTASLLREFVRRASIQGESFLVGENGGLVAATNRTSDFYQADEAQYFNTIGLQKGEAWIDEASFPDESAGAILQKIAFPVYLDGDEDPEIADGVLVVGLDAFVIGTATGCKK